MDHNALQHYMAHLKVTIFDANYKQVHDGWYEDKRKVAWNKLYFIESGQGLITINDKKYSPQPGQVLFIPEGSIQSLQLISPKSYVKHWCHFHANVGASPIGDLLDFPLLLQVQDVDRFRDLFSQLVDQYHSKNGFGPLLANSLLMALLHHHFTYNAKGQIQINHQTETTKVNALLTYMQDNIHRKLPLEEMAATLNLHPNYLIRLFKSTFGTSPVDYFNRLKITRATELLTATDRPINMIADNLGYGSPYYFSSVFKKQTGYTPKAYRQQYR